MDQKLSPSAQTLHDELDELYNVSTPAELLAVRLAEVATIAPANTTFPSGYRTPAGAKAHAIINFLGKRVVGSGASPLRAQIALRDKLVTLATAAIEADRDAPTAPDAEE